MLDLYVYLIVLISALVFKVDSQPTGVEYTITNDGSGYSYFRYEAKDGTFREETVEIVNKGTENEHPVIKGYYSYIDSEGKFAQTRYEADDKGFRIVDEPENIIIPIIGSSAIATLQGGGVG